jgi:ATP-dependent DNA ligase
VTLSIKPNYEPMEATPVAELPTGPDWQYEPKWDGFRCLAFRDGSRVELRSKSGRSLARYFPELIAALRELEPATFALDGEIVVPDGKALNFDALLQRIHPAASRVTRLAAETPAIYIVFDLLVTAENRRIVDEPLRDRRAFLEKFAGTYLGAKTDMVRLSPATASVRVARGWLAGRSGLDGVIAKRVDAPYGSGDRLAMEKVKRVRTADCVVGGFRYASKGHVVGSLLLGLYDDEGLLNHVGFTSALSKADRTELTAKLEKLIKPPGFTGRKPGGPSRWTTDRSADWQPLQPRLVVEVTFDHASGGRFRHGTGFVRWRPDKAPRQCTMEQMVQPVASVNDLLRSRKRKGTRKRARSASK